MIVAIHQPNFLPWLGYFNKIMHSDVFVFFDNVQFPRSRSYCSRVKIKTPTGPAWLTVPVEGKSSLNSIAEIKLSNQHLWQNKHLRTITANYQKTPYFHKIYPLLEEVYSAKWTYLADFNIALITRICAYLGIEAKLIRSTEMQIKPEQGLTNILNILNELGASSYISGVGAGTARYFDEQAFRQQGIALIFQGFSHPVYPQQWGEFSPDLSIIDLLFNCGPEALKMLE